MTLKRTVELVYVASLAPNVRLLRFRTVDVRAFEFTAGQWIDLWIDTPSGVEKRAYSIASAPGMLRADELEIAVTHVTDGVVSPALHALVLGSRIEISVPCGFFTRGGHEREPAVLVATGTGVCPLRAMLHAELASSEGPALTLLFGARTEADILWRDEFEMLATRYASRFRYFVTLSRPDAQWSGLRGYVQTHLADVIDMAAKPHVYVCGLTRMVSEVRRELKESYGYERQRIHSERYD
jgi:CDP-4-dehydro-6-deoxyglucose reductase, E3